MRIVSVAASILLTLGCVAAARAADTPDSGPIPQTEQSNVLTLPPGGPHRVLVTDGVFNHGKDGRVYVIDADHVRMLGMIPAAYNANIVADPNGKRYYIGETIWTRGNRGARQDLVSFYDSHTLNLTDEISLPGRALITTKKQDMDISADGHWVYVFNFTPSNSVVVVDTRTKKVAGSVDVPGCGLVFAWGANGFTSICADGSLANIDVSDPHKPVVTHTPAFFPPDKDAVFEQSPTERSSGRTFFISYTGLVYPATLGSQPKIGKPWSIQEAAGMKRASDSSAPFQIAWRPGGWQIAAVHHSDAHLFVLMHKGTFWTHKTDGSEIWELDTGTHKLVRRIRLSQPSNLVGLTQDQAPLLFAATDAGGFLVLDPKTGKTLRHIAKLGDNLLFTMAQGE